MTEKIVSPLIDEPSQTGGTGQRRSRSVLKLESWGSGWSVHGDRLLEGMGVVLLNHVHPTSSLWDVSASSFFSEESKLYTLYSLGWPVRGWSRSRSWYIGSQYCPHPDITESFFSRELIEFNPPRNQNLCHQYQAWVKLQLALHLLLLTILQFYHLPPPPVSNSSCLFTCCQPPYVSCYTVLLYFSRYCSLCFLYFLCLLVFYVLLVQKVF